MSRIKHSLGQCGYNKGEKRQINEERFVLDTKREFYIFDVIPMGAVRMTVSDKWKTNPDHPDPRKRQRKSVKEYFSFKTLLKSHANIMNFKLYETIEAVYFIPMPDSWSKKKKELMNGMPHKTKPDTDNITKAVKDALLKDDSVVWYEVAEKRWAYKGSILIYE